MKANFFYSNLNPCGGGERLTLVTMKAVLDIGIDIYLTTLEKPIISKLENAYGKDIASVIRKIKKINVLQMLDEQSIKKDFENGGYDIIINTHGDIDPYYNDSLSKNNAITYCHFPSAKFFIETEDKAYLEKHLKIYRALSQSSKPTSSLLSSSKLNISSSTSMDSIEIIEDNNTICNFDIKQYLKWLKDAYDNMMQNTTVITNSEYSKKAIFNEYGIEDIIIISPPVDVEKFQSLLQFNNHVNEKRKETVLVISRIDPSKEIENAINLAKILKDKRIAKEMIIVGSLDPYFNEYYYHLQQMIEEFALTDYIKFEIDVEFEKLLSYMTTSKVYFHPRSGEHFGISIVEAMSAGLIPVVSDKGGQTEFIPSKYQYHTLDQASQIISLALNTSDEEREKISNSVGKFSVSNYVKNFQNIVKDRLNSKKSHDEKFNK